MTHICSSSPLNHRSMSRKLWSVKRHAECACIALALTFTLAAMNANAASKVCPLELSIDGKRAAKIECTTDDQVLTSTPSNPPFDGVFGPDDALRQGAPVSVCPNSRYLGRQYDIPNYRDRNFVGAVTRVESSTEFRSAVKSMSPGDVVIVAPGFYHNMYMTMNSADSGTEKKPKYILSETVRGAKLTGNSKFYLNGADHIVIAGFERRASQDLAIGIGSKHIRYACNYTDNEETFSYTSIAIQKHERTIDVASHIEIDNNISINHKRKWFHLSQCAYWNYDNPIVRANCPATPNTFYIHSNKIFSAESGIQPKINNVPRQHEYFFYSGIGYSHARNSQRYPNDPNNPTGQPIDATDIIFENNHVRWLQFNRTPSTDIKSGRNVFRYNCFEDTVPAFRPRQGDDNLVYGNWYRGTAKNSMDTPLFGRGNYRIFEFYENYKMAPAISLFMNNQFANSSYKYKNFVYAFESLHNIYAHNVWSNAGAWIQWRDYEGNHQQAIASPLQPITNNGFEIYNNKIYSSANSVSNYVLRDDPPVGNAGYILTEEQFQAQNPEWVKSSNIVEQGVKTSSPECFTPGYVRGIPGSVTTHENVLGGVQKIEQPSWW